MCLFINSRTGILQGCDVTPLAKRALLPRPSCERRHDVNQQMAPRSLGEDLQPGAESARLSPQQLETAADGMPATAGMTAGTLQSPEASAITDNWTLCSIAGSGSKRRKTSNCCIIGQALCEENPLLPASGLILGLRPANERRCYKVTLSLIGWAQT